MTIAFGVAFPFAAALATRLDESVSADLALIYTANTVGAIGGALLTGFVTISWFGLHGTIRAVTIVSAIGALLIVWAGQARSRARLVSVVVAVAVLALGVWLPPWDRLLLSSGAYKYAAALRGLISKPPCVRAAFSITERGHQERLPCAGSPGRPRLRSTARSTRRTRATC